MGQQDHPGTPWQPAGVKCDDHEVNDRAPLHPPQRASDSPEAASGESDAGRVDPSAPQLRLSAQGTVRGRATTLRAQPYRAPSGRPLGSGSEDAALRVLLVDSLSGNAARFAGHLQQVMAALRPESASGGSYALVRCDLRRLSAAERQALIERLVDSPGQGALLITHTFEQGNVSAVSAQLLREWHSADPQGRGARLMGVLSSGSVNWGPLFGRGGAMVSATEKCALLGPINKSGTRDDLRLAAQWAIRAFDGRLDPPVPALLDADLNQPGLNERDLRGAS